jgi:hypothetical protein
MYNEYIDGFDTDVAIPDTGWHISLIVQERHAYQLLWQWQYQKAADAYASLAANADEHDPRLVLKQANLSC